MQGSEQGSFCQRAAGGGQAVDGGRDDAARVPGAFSDRIQAGDGLGFAGIAAEKADRRGGTGFRGGENRVRRAGVREMAGSTERRSAGVTPGR